MRDIELGYVAGILDGEGSITIQPYANNRVMVRVASTDIDILHKVHNFTGVGTVYERKTKQLNRKPSWEWVVTNQQHVLTLLSTVFPLLSKRRQEKAFEAILILENKVAMKVENRI